MSITSTIRKVVPNRKTNAEAFVVSFEGLHKWMHRTDVKCNVRTKGISEMFCNYNSAKNLLESHKVFGCSCLLKEK